MNEEAIELLREIRDLQKLHVENYKDALKNQQRSIDIQQKGARTYCIVVSVFFVSLLVLIATLVLPSLGHHPS